MMRTTKVVSITLPPPLFEQAQALAKEENRTISELMREALRRYQSERMWERLRSFGTISAEMAGVKNEEDIVKLVRQVRREMAEEEAARASQLATGTE
jgi:CopG family transcriptional regulator/antitoxin EndoAI